MEDLPANLDDGEQWLPSDIFPLDEPLPHRPIGSARGGSVEDLSRRFSNLDFLHHPSSFAPKVPSISQRLGVLQQALTAPTTNGCFGLTVGPIGVDHGVFSYASGPVYPIPDQPAPRFPLHKPAHPQPSWAGVSAAEQLLETRIATSSSRAVQGQHRNRLFPFQATAFRFIRDCRSTTSGTGVFIPRATTPSLKTSTYDAPKKNPGVTPQKGPAKKFPMKKTGDFYCYHQVHSSEVGLPKDWTY